MKAYGGIDVYIHVFLTPALVGSSQFDALAALSPGIGDWVSPRACVDGMEKWKLLTLQDSNSDSSAVQPLACRYIDCATAAHDLLRFCSNKHYRNFSNK
jgi:hypothetical protein